MMEHRDLELLRRAQGGDVEAFAELFESMRPAVFSVATRLAGPSDAEDVVMNTYLKAWQAVPQFGGRSSLQTWLYRIANNCAIDLIRRRRPGQVPLEAEGHDGRSILDTAADESAEGPDESVSRKETVAEVQEALAQLPEEHRVVLLLRYCDGLAYRDIVAATGLPLGTVMSRLFYGKKKLKRIMALGGEV